MNPEQLYEQLKKIQEPRGYFFNKDKQYVLELLAALITNKDRYGYMACPCRLASNDRNHDKDIVCPCVYRSEDVAQFGSCYCNLYVSADWNSGKIENQFVPERRPPEKMLF